MKDRSKCGRRYEAQFKQDAVALVQSVRPCTRAAREPGISTSALEGWLQRAQAGRTLGASGAQGLPAEAEELRRLRRELDDVRLQRDILKKALAICSTPKPLRQCRRGIRLRARRLGAHP